MQKAKALSCKTMARRGPNCRAVVPKVHVALALTALLGLIRHAHAQDAEAETECTEWAQLNYCKHADYADYMREYCARECVLAGTPAGVDAAPADAATAAGAAAADAADADAHAAAANNNNKNNNDDDAQSRGGDSESVADQLVGGAEEEPEMCADWVQLGYCVAGTHVDYMRRTCAKACEEAAAAGTAPDALYQAPAADCKTWAASYACSEHSAYMTQHCIGFCEDGEPVKIKSKPPSTITTIGSMSILVGFCYAASRLYKYTMDIDADRSLSARRQIRKVLASDHESIALGYAGTSSTRGSTKKKRV